VLESKADMQKRGQASPDDGDALALTFAQAVAPPEKEEERDEDDEFGGYGLVDAMSPPTSRKRGVPYFSVSVCDLARLTGLANSRLITSESRE
jgi:hypothetical protein